MRKAIHSFCVSCIKQLIRQSNRVHQKIISSHRDSISHENLIITCETRLIKRAITYIEDEKQQWRSK